MLPGVQVARKMHPGLFRADPGLPKTILESNVETHPVVRACSLFGGASRGEATLPGLTGSEADHPPETAVRRAPATRL